MTRNRLVYINNYKKYFYATAKTYTILTRLLRSLMTSDIALKKRSPGG